MGDQQAKLTNETARMRASFEQLSDELRKVEGSLEDISFGLYKPQYNFDTPEQFKAEMDRVYDRQKEMVRAGKAASFAVSWTVGNSKREGERMQKQYSKLLLRSAGLVCAIQLDCLSAEGTDSSEFVRGAVHAVNAQHAHTAAAELRRIRSSSQIDKPSRDTACTTSKASSSDR